MSTQSDRMEGVAQQVGGKIKEVAGKVLRDDEMVAEGKAKQVEGKAREEAAKATERGKGKIEEAVGGHVELPADLGADEVNGFEARRRGRIASHGEQAADLNAPHVQ